MVIILGIESTAHTFGIGIVEKGKILCNVRDMYTTEIGGIIPTESAKHHVRVSEELYKKALENAHIYERQICAIAISQAPGLAPCLLEGMRFAKKKAKELNVSIIPVNHCVAHLEIGKITGAKDPVLLYASGANTQIIAYAAGKYRVFGETLDIGIGNFIDTFARHTGLGFPGGPKIMELAKTGKYIEVPYSIKGMDVAFSGLLTNLKQKYDKKIPIEDLSYSLQETAFAMLVEASERALAHTGKKELLLGGGVGCNTRLQEMCRIMCEERGCKFFVPENQYLVDNAAMICFLGEIIYNSYNKINNNVNNKKIDNIINVNKENIKIGEGSEGNKKKTEQGKLIYYPKDFDKLDINPRERTDDVIVKWK
jgi:N6-L-threonylcarbamoyladenine synthase